MVHLGKRVDGKYTRRSLAAEKLNECLMQVAKRRKDLQVASKEASELIAEYESLTERIKNKDRLYSQFKASLTEASAQAMREDPSTDASKLEREAQTALDKFEQEHRRSFGRLEELKQAITHKRTVARRHEDRIEFYRRQVAMVLRESEAA
jgi:chromosome segregation ATPase